MISSKEQQTTTTGKELTRDARLLLFFFGGRQRGKISARVDGMRLAPRFKSGSTIHPHILYVSFEYDASVRMFPHKNAIVFLPMVLSVLVALFHYSKIVDNNTHNPKPYILTVDGSPVKGSQKTTRYSLFVAVNPSID